MQPTNQEILTGDTGLTWRLRDVILITAVSGFILLAGIYGLSWVNQISAPGETGSPSLFYTAALAGLEAVALLLGVYLMGLLPRGLHWSDIGFHRVSRRWLILAASITILMIPAVGLITLLIQIVLGRPIENPQLEFLVPENFSWSAALSMLVFGGIVVPIAEEIYFRGVIYRWLRQFTAPWIAIVVSSLFFGLMHGEISVAGASFLIGLLLAWIYERSRSLWPSIVIHITNNALKLLLLYILLAAGVNIQV